jgi:hypothetical protein
MQQTAAKVAARSGNPDAALAWEILDLHDAIAVVKLRAAQERFEGRWLVRHILWQWHPQDPK